MAKDPTSFMAFQRRFPDDACAAYLAALRWPDGFHCPACGHDEAWMLETKSWTYECAGCRKQTSITAGTVMREQAAAEHVVPRCFPDGHALRRSFGIGIAKTIGAGIL